MKIMQFLQCFGFGNEIGAKLQNKHDLIVGTVNNCLDKNKLADLRA